MAQDHIRYDILLRKRCAASCARSCRKWRKTGLPGEHHFFISFITKAPGVRISQRLLDQYPNDMTIVLQNQFWDLKVGETGFEVGLSFDDKPETLVVPFTAIKGFFDPSVQFGLQFDRRRRRCRPTTKWPRPPSRPSWRPLRPARPPRPRRPAKKS